MNHILNKNLYCDTLTTSIKQNIQHKGEKKNKERGFMFKQKE
jgi:hypothetical protein